MYRKHVQISHVNESTGTYCIKCEHQRLKMEQCYLKKLTQKPLKKNKNSSQAIDNNK